jgi:hypothetical protein
MPVFKLAAKVREAFVIWAGRGTKKPNITHNLPADKP